MNTNRAVGYGYFRLAAHKVIVGVSVNSGVHYRLVRVDMVPGRSLW
jgi:hypothetical protein